MPESLKQPNFPNDEENFGVEEKPEGAEKSESGAGNEPRYTPGEYRVEIPVDVAREDIEKNFPDIKVERIEYLNEGMGSTAFLVNGEFVFRLAKNEKADASLGKEIKVLPQIEKQIDLPIPAFEYVGRQRNQLRMVGYKKIEGEGLGKTDFVSPEGNIDTEPTKQLATFFQQLHSDLIQWCQ